MSTSSSEIRKLPCVMQLGFAGSRRMVEAAASDERVRKVLLDQIEQYLTRRLGEIPGELKLGDHHFVCGISQIAIGADMLFTRACAKLQWPQRIFLPQHLDAYLTATGSDGTPDFNPDEREQSRQLADSPHIIQQRMVSDANDRHTRFEDANREILRASDVIVCLLAADASDKRGGTNDFLDLAKARGMTTLEIRVDARGGELSVNHQWHNLDGFEMPTLPSVVADLPAPAKGGLPNVGQFCGVVKEHVSKLATYYTALFNIAALLIIITHILATLFATLALLFHLLDKEGFHLHSWIAWLLGIELVALFAGCSTHVWFHRGHPSGRWALSRLLAEINRSVRGLGRLHTYPDYLLNLNLPQELRPLLRTLNILHLHTTRPYRDEPWRGLRDAYLTERLTNPDPKKGQIAYYSVHSATAKFRRNVTSVVFYACSSLAILATAIKLVVTVHMLPDSIAHLFDQSKELESLVTGALGTLAVVLPVLAVGALSWAAAKDYEARVHIYDEMVKFLKAQVQQLNDAASARELEHLVLETETRLLSETAEWYSRRKFTGVT